MEAKLNRVVGEKTAKALAEQCGVETVMDLLRYYPRRYVERGELTNIEELSEGEDVTISARIESSKVRRIPGRKGAILEVIVTDGRAKLSLTFFNQAWREKELREGRSGLFAGKVGTYRGKRQLAHPEYLLVPEGEDASAAADEFAGKLIAFYPATSKLPSWRISQSIDLVLPFVDEVEEVIPDDILMREGYPKITDALRAIHRPGLRTEAEKARERLVFEEAFLLQTYLLQRRHELKTMLTRQREISSGGLRERFDARLPFELTPGQKKVSAEIESDLRDVHPMFRLLQGDVGSGKTIIALRAMLSMVDAGAQCALLAPTEVLAQQHFRNFRALLGEIAEGGMLGGAEDGTQIALLTGSMSAADRQRSKEMVRSGQCGIVVGTHALLSDDVEFQDLGLIVIDEQHRFGVEQRDALRAKGETPPHVLVMTATPIPRTVAMTIFGDLDISTLDEVPLGRTPITTHVVAADEKPHHLARVWERIREEVSAGHQVYVVAPRISSSDNDEKNANLSEEEVALARRMMGEEEGNSPSMVAVESLYEELHNGALHGVSTSILHGRMPADEKDRIMDDFVSGKVSVLISTTVIEVGVDVSNATMMVIMDADRFGISQLHQLRGRVGRGSSPGLCILVTRVGHENPAMRRLDAVASTTDGFELSRLDLEERREGDVLGSAQSGARSHLRLLRVVRDELLIGRARDCAREIIEGDPTLASHEILRLQVERLRNEERASYLEKK